MLEMRLVVAMLMRKFDFRFADGYDPAQWDRELVDVFVLETGKLPVVISLRKEGRA